jgi:hypothetical protein
MFLGAFRDRAKAKRRTLSKASLRRKNFHGRAHNPRSLARPDETREASVSRKVASAQPFRDAQR